MQAGETDLKNLRKLGKIGCKGAYPNKCYGDIMKCIPYNIGIPQGITCSLPFKTGLNDLWQTFAAPYMFAALWSQYQCIWELQHSAVCGAFARLLENQSITSRNEWESSSCSGRSRNTSDTDIIHGDDVPITGVGKSCVPRWLSFPGLQWWAPEQHAPLSSLYTGYSTNFDVSILTKTTIL